MKNSAVIAIVVSAGLLAIGCDEKKPAAPAASSAAPKATAAASANPSATASASAAAKAKPAPKSQAKAKLDKKPDAPMQGATATIPGTNGVFTVPAKWKTETHGDWMVSAPPNAPEKEDVGVAATHYAKGDDPTHKLGELAKAAQLTDCEWKSPEDATLGADDFPAKVADGVCMQDGKWYDVMYAMIPGDDLNVFVFAAEPEEATPAASDELVNVIRSLHKKK